MLLRLVPVVWLAGPCLQAGHVPPCWLVRRVLGVYASGHKGSFSPSQLREDDSEVPAPVVAVQCKEPVVTPEGESRGSVGGAACEVGSVWPQSCTETRLCLGLRLPWLWLWSAP